MMHHRRFCISIACLAFASSAASGCGDKPSTSGTTQTSSSGTVATATGDERNVPKVAYADTDLSVPEDFEVAARDAVRADTYRRELDVLAKELDPPH